jgi:hypothetical protein
MNSKLLWFHSVRPNIGSKKREVGVSLWWQCHTLVLPAPGYRRLFLNLVIFSKCKNVQFQSNFRSKLKHWNFSNFTLWNLIFSEFSIWPKIALKLNIFPLWKNYEIYKTSSVTWSRKDNAGVALSWAILLHNFLLGCVIIWGTLCL